MQQWVMAPFNGTEDDAIIAASATATAEQSRQNAAPPAAAPRIESRERELQRRNSRELSSFLHRAARTPPASLSTSPLIFSAGSFLGQMQGGLAAAPTLITDFRALTFQP